jgi:predicted Zn-dependent protease
MHRDTLANAIPVLLFLYRNSGYEEFKEGYASDSEGFEQIVKLGWAIETDQGGPWRRVAISLDGQDILNRIFQAAGGL